MFVSDIVDTNFIIQLPNTDSYASLHQRDITDFVKKYGNVEVVLFNKTIRMYKVPSFEKGREEYINMKFADCNKWGCE